MNEVSDDLGEPHVRKVEELDGNLKNMPSEDQSSGIHSIEAKQTHVITHANVADISQHKSTPKRRLTWLPKIPLVYQLTTECCRITLCV